MQDQPSAVELIEAVTEFIRNHATPQLQGHTAFHARVAANALDIVKRELEVGPAANAGEAARLKALLGMDGSLDELNRELCRRIEAGEVGLHTPALEEHLWQTTLTKLAIDQPNYSGYRRALEESGKD
ncbi:DUF6285 domain-containing protein [Parvibaculum sp.]|jgi:hypothetical protein|uniref:DUF6285 domain-containing protein n=1 Tax=Parvibaculum sp. TaxID=2024848 RepID=UPI000C42C6AF|nr:DUF6285 domain-containing protein [Parvibaculum sp.]MAM93629.1 hypothetical protein [Parvibaculum sp.]|tara:strand:- start:35346 stop:35729 length:384 start_codon:yes stop_codon:yes gene_type:complete